jgi:hypothetical protein
LEELQEPWLQQGLPCCRPAERLLALRLRALVRHLPAPCSS